MVGRIAQEGSESERGLKVEGHEHWFGGLTSDDLLSEERVVLDVAGGLAEVAGPEVSGLLGNFSGGESANPPAISIALEELVRCIVLRQAESAQLSVGIDEGVLELDGTSNVGVAALDDALQVWVVAELDSISWVELLELWHELLKESLPGHIAIDDSRGAEVETSGSRVLQGLVKSVLAVLLIESDNGHSSLGGSHLGNEYLSGVLLIEPEDELVAWGVATLDKAIGESTRVPIKLLEIPVEMLSVESNGIEHVVGGHGDLVHSSGSVCWEFRVHYRGLIHMSDGTYASWRNLF